VRSLRSARCWRVGQAGIAELLEPAWEPSSYSRPEVVELRYRPNKLEAGAPLFCHAATPAKGGFPLIVINKWRHGDEFAS
jgi:hypothetical protein